MLNPVLLGSVRWMEDRLRGQHSVIGRVSVPDRTEAVSIGSSCSISYLNFESELIFLVISAMVASVRDNFGANP